MLALQDMFATYQLQCNSETGRNEFKRPCVHDNLYDISIFQ